MLMMADDADDDDIDDDDVGDDTCTGCILRIFSSTTVSQI